MSNIDAIGLLMEIVRCGHYAVISYRKDHENGVTERTIVPWQLREGLDGPMIRAYQVRPESGIRTFKCRGIVKVIQHEEKLPQRSFTRAIQGFCSGEIVELAATVRRSARGVEATIQASDNVVPAVQAAATRVAWSHSWFTEFGRVVRDAVLDLQVTPDDKRRLLAASVRLGLTIEQENAVLSYVLGEEMMGISVDGNASTDELDRLDILSECVRQLRRRS